MMHSLFSNPTGEIYLNLPSWEAAFVLVSNVNLKLDVINGRLVHLYLIKYSLMGFTVIILKAHIEFPQVNSSETRTHFINDGVSESNWQYFFS